MRSAEAVGIDLDENEPFAVEESIAPNPEGAADVHVNPTGPDPKIELALEILERRWPELDKRTMEVFASQALERPISQTDVARELSKRLTKLINAQLPSWRERRQGRGKLVPIRQQDISNRDKPSTELSPETTESTDQTLRRISLDSAESGTNRHILREHERAADDVEHILEGVSPTDRNVLQAVLPTVEAGESLRETAAKAGLHATQLQRAYQGAKRARDIEFFKEKKKPAPSYRPYNPRGVSREDYNRTPGQATLPYFGDMRTSVGIDVNPKRNASHRTEPALGGATKIGISGQENGGPQSAVNRYPSRNGCNHAGRQWRRKDYAYLELICLGCGIELDRKYAF